MPFDRWWDTGHQSPSPRAARHLPLPAGAGADAPDWGGPTALGPTGLRDRPWRQKPNPRTPCRDLRRRSSRNRRTSAPPPTDSRHGASWPTRIARSAWTRVAVIASAPIRRCVTTTLRWSSSGRRRAAAGTPERRRGRRIHLSRGVVGRDPIVGSPRHRQSISHVRWTVRCRSIDDRSSSRSRRLAPIFRRGGHSQGWDDGADAVGAFFGRLLVTVDYIPDFERRLAAAPPLARYAAFIAHTEMRQIARCRAWRWMLDRSPRRYGRRPCGCGATSLISGRAVCGCWTTSDGPEVTPCPERPRLRAGRLWDRGTRQSTIEVLVAQAVRADRRAASRVTGAILSRRRVSDRRQGRGHEETMMKNILLAYDGGEPAKRPLRWRSS